MGAVRHLVIIGPMGVGKTTTATGVASELALPLRDSDADIEARTGRTGREIAETDGVPALHELEAAVLLESLASTTPAVIAAAASVVDRGDCRMALDTAFVTTLDLPPEPLLDRIRSGDHRRTVTVDEITALIDRREPALAALADLRLDAQLATADLVRSIVDAVS